MKIEKWLPTIAAGVMGAVLALCGHDFRDWKFWVLSACGWLSTFAGYRYAKWGNNREAVHEAVEQVRQEFEKDTPRMVCLMVSNPGILSKEVQRHIWNLDGMEAKSWKDEEQLTLSRKVEK